MNNTPDTRSGRRAPRRDWFAFDRSDRAVLVALLALVTVLSISILVVGPVVAWVRSEPLAVPYVSAVTVSPLDAVGQPYGEAHYDLLVTAPTPVQRLLDLAPGILLLGLILLVCWLVFRLLLDVGAGEPFARRNITRLRLVAALLGFGVPIATFARLPCTGAILGGLDLGTLPFAAQIEIPWLPLLIGACLALVAEAFKTGARLRADVDGLV